MKQEQPRGNGCACGSEKAIQDESRKARVRAGLGRVMLPPYFLDFLLCYMFLSINRFYTHVCIFLAVVYYCLLRLLSCPICTRPSRLSLFPPWFLSSETQVTRRELHTPTLPAATGAKPRLEFTLPHMHSLYLPI